MDDDPQSLGELLSEVLNLIDACLERHLPQEEIEAMLAQLYVDQRTGLAPDDGMVIPWQTPIVWN